MDRRSDLFAEEPDAPMQLFACRIDGEVVNGDELDRANASGSIRGKTSLSVKARRLGSGDASGARTPEDRLQLSS